MSSIPRLRQYGELTLSDFDLSSIWVGVHGWDTEESWYEETDEVTYRPLAKSEDLDADFLLVKSQFTLLDGSKYIGFITPQSTSLAYDLGIIQPCFFTSPSDFIGFWNGIRKPSRADLKVFYESISKSKSEVFPIQFEMLGDKPVGAHQSGMIEAFYYIKSRSHIKKIK